MTASKKRAARAAEDGGGEPQGLLDRTLDLIEQRVAAERGKKSRLAVLTEIANGSDVTTEWLRKATAPKGRTPNPGVVFVQRVHDYLVNQGQSHG